MTEDDKIRMAMADTPSDAGFYDGIPGDPNNPGVTRHPVSEDRTALMRELSKPNLTSTQREILKAELQKLGGDDTSVPTSVAMRSAQPAAAQVDTSSDLASFLDQRAGRSSSPAGGNTLSLEDFLAQRTPAAPAAAPQSAMRRAGDAAVALGKGIIGVPEAAVGIADLATGGQVGKFLENEGGDFGFRPKEAREYLDTFKSEAQKRADAEVANAKGLIDTARAVVGNPSTAVMAAIESVPSIGAGGVIGRGVLAAAPKVGGIVAGAIGEGTISAGQNAEQVRQETPGGLLTGEQSAVLATSGAVTGALSLLGGRVAHAMGISDINTLAAGGAGETAKKGFVKRFIEGAFSEGVLEELPQSVQEQVAQNYAQGKPLDEGVNQAAVLGLFTGGMIGGSVAAAHTTQPQQKPGPENALADLDAAQDVDAAVAAAIDLADSYSHLAGAVTDYLTPGALAAAAQLPEGRTALSGEAQRQALDAQAKALGTAQTAGFEAERNAALQQAGVAQELAVGTPQAGAAESYADLTPMDLKQARNRLLIMRDQAEGDPNSLVIVKHPSQPGAFAIQQLPAPGTGMPAEAAPLSQTPTSAQAQIESAALAGKEANRRLEDRQRQEMITRTMQSISDRGGVASPEEARILREANLGRPYDRIDPGLSTPEPTLKTDDKLTRATGIQLPGQPRSTTVYGSDAQTASEAAAQRESQATTTVTPKAPVEQQANPPAQPPSMLAIADAMMRAPFKRTADQKAVLNAARQHYTSAQMETLQRAADNPASLSAEERIWIKGQAQADQILSGVKLSTERSPMPGGEIKVNHENTAHSIRVEDPSKLRGYPLLREIARLAGHKVVAYSSETLKAGGFVSNDGNTIYLNVNSRMNPLVEFGHELGHLIEQNHPEIADAMKAVVGKNTDLEAARRDYTNTPEGEAVPAETRPGEALSEATSDLLGNRFSEPEFWTEVFRQVAEAHGNQKAGGIIQRLVAALNAALNKLLAQVRGSTYRADSFVKDIEAVKSALSKGMSAYLQARHETAIKTNAIDEAAHAAATSPKNDLAQPTAAQKEAGNYKKGHLTFQGLDITIENPRGSKREGVDPNGKPWSVEMEHHYGYIKGTVGKDKDHIDVFIGKSPTSRMVYIVDQVNQKGGFDEHKVMLGFDSIAAARKGYADNYTAGWKVGPMTAVPINDFKAWLANGDTTKPYSKGALNGSESTREAVEPVTASTDRQTAEEQRRGPRPVSITGIHYSKGQRTTLSGAYYGSGLKGAEAERLANAEDSRLKKRVYFYTDEGKGVIPEAGVGAFAHEAKLDNLYDATTGEIRGSSLNDFETKVLDAGYDGYVIGVGNQLTGQKVAVVMGDATVDAKYVGNGPKASVGYLSKQSETQGSGASTALRNMFRNNPERAFREPGWAVLTATQEAKGSASDEANVKANEDLEAELKKRGIAYQPVKGSYQGVDQGANFLIFADESVAKELGAKYGQESVLTTKGLVYTDGSGKLVPAVHKNDIVGDEARKEDFYSELPDGTAFSLGLNFEEAPAESVTASSERGGVSDERRREIAETELRKAVSLAGIKADMGKKLIATAEENAKYPPLDDKEREVFNLLTLQRLNPKNTRVRRKDLDAAKDADLIDKNGRLTSAGDALLGSFRLREMADAARFMERKRTGGGITASAERDDTWYSGAPKGLSELAPREAREGNLYGPGVYVAKDKSFADTYGRGENEVYELSFKPEKPFNTATINSRAEAEKMLVSMGVKKSELAGLLGQKPRVANDSIYEALAKSLGGKRAANEALQDAGYDAILFKDRRGNQLAVSFKSISTNAPEVDVESYSNARGAVIDEEKVPFLVGLTKKQAQVSLITDLYSPFKLEERPKFKTVADVAAYLEKRTLRALRGEPITESTNANRKFLSGIIAAEANAAFSKEGHAGQWYKQSIVDAIASASELHPEIATDSNQKFLFQFALALTSNGQSVPDNVKLAFEVYEGFKRDGKFPTWINGGGKNARAIVDSLAYAGDMIDHIGLDAFRQAMLTTWKARDLMEWSGRNVEAFLDDQVYGGSIFGPKIGGAFLQNLNGNFDALTIDRWMMRTWGRLTGRLIDPKAENGIIDTPGSAGRRAFIRDTMSEALDKLKETGNTIDMADLQAAIWYPEKELYALLGRNNAKAAPTDYATEVRKFIEKRRSGDDERASPGGRRDAAAPGVEEDAGVQSALFSNERADDDELKKFAKDLGDRVRTSVEYGQMLGRRHSWAYNVGDQLLSTKTGKVYELTGRTFQRVGKLKDNNWQPVYSYKADGGEERGTFPEKNLLESKTMKNLTTPTMLSTERVYGTLNADQEASLKRVGAFPTETTFAERMAGLKHDLGLRVTQGLVDQFAALKKIDPKAYMLARLSKGSDGTMEAALLYGKPFLRDGVADVDVKDGGFVKTLAKLKGEQDRFLWWVAAQRAERLKAEGKEFLFTGEDISNLKSLSEGEFADGSKRAPVYAEAMRDLNEFNDAVLALAEESGLVDPEARKLFKDHPYVPFYRVMNDAEASGPRFSSGLVNQKAWKKLKGSSKQLNADLLSNMLQNWAHLYSAAAKNRAALAALKSATSMDVAYPIEGWESKKGAVTVMDGGKAVQYKVEDPYMMEAISALNYTTPEFFKPFSAMKRWLTIGVTASPTFKIRNLIRDSLSAIAQADLSANAFSNVASGWAATKEGSQTLASMTAGGGMIHFGSSHEGDRSHRARKMIEKAGGKVLDATGWKALTGQMEMLWDAYSELGDRGENVNRAALYEQLRAKGVSHAEANFMARDLLDFSMSGRWPVVRFLTETVPFLNARLQGLYKLGRAAKENPKRLGAMVGAVSLASLALMLGYEDDEDWKKREDWDRDSYWWFKIGDMAFRVPKPFEIGAIGSLAERTWEMGFNKEMTGERYRQRLSAAIFQTFAMDPTPQIVKPLLDVWGNKDSFTQRPIEGPSLQNLRPQDRYDERTTTVAKWLGMLGLPDPAQLAKGQYTALSPKQIDFLIRGYFGSLGATTAVALDWGLRPLTGAGERPDPQLRDIFLAGAFTETLPSNSSRYLTQLYNNATAIEQAYASYQAAVKSGDLEKAREILGDEKAKIQLYPTVEALKRAESDLNRQIKQVEASKTLSGETKRRLIDMLSGKKNALAERMPLPS